MSTRALYFTERAKGWIPPAYLQTFAYLQVLDFLTTMIGLRIGLSEASPSIAPMIGALGPAAAVGMSKVIAFSLAGFCMATKRERIVKLINYWFAALVAWNMVLIVYVVSRG